MIGKNVSSRLSDLHGKYLLGTETSGLALPRLWDGRGFGGASLSDLDMSLPSAPGRPLNDASAELGT